MAYYMSASASNNIYAPERGYAAVPENQSRFFAWFFDATEQNPWAADGCIAGKEFYHRP